MRFLRLWHSPTLVVIAAALLKWLTIIESDRVLWSMSLDLSVHFRSKQGELTSLFSTQPLFFKAFFISGYPPEQINTLVFSSTLYFFFQVDKSVMLGKTTRFGLFLSMNASIPPPSILLLFFYFYLVFLLSLSPSIFLDIFPTS